MTAWLLLVIVGSVFNGGGRYEFTVKMPTEVACTELAVSIQALPMGVDVGNTAIWTSGCREEVTERRWNASVPLCDF